MGNSQRKVSSSARSYPAFATISALLDSLRKQEKQRYVFESDMEACLKMCQDKYLSALGKLKTPVLSKWLVHLIERQFIPALRKTGFDERIARTLFELAAPAWERMTHVTEKEVLLTPALVKRMKEIRSGILLGEKREKDIRTTISGMDPEDVFFAARKQASPEYLSFLVQAVCTSWIILPRVYDHLKKEHSHYFLGYLRYFNKERGRKCKKILARIIIEFMGNYAFMHADDLHPGNQIREILFYGYSVMFWKNLKNPPPGMEDLDLFDHYLRWVGMFQKRFARLDLDMARVVDQMKESVERAFPQSNAFVLAKGTRRNRGRFLVTLRHGDRGIRAALGYFAPGGRLLNDTPEGCYPNSDTLMELRYLLKATKKRFPSETPRAQGFIRIFLSRLAEEYESDLKTAGYSEHNTPHVSAFLVPRILCMIRELKESLDQSLSVGL